MTNFMSFLDTNFTFVFSRALAEMMPSKSYNTCAIKSYPLSNLVHIISEAFRSKIAKKIRKKGAV